MRQDQPAPAAPATAVNPGAWNMLCGAMARRSGKRRGGNPHPRGTPGHVCWAYGWRHPCRPARRNTPRETSRPGLAGGGPKAKGPGFAGGAPKAKGPGRGHARVGNRGVWSEAELALLRYCSGGADQVRTANLAAMLGRPEQGVRAKRCRLRKEAAP